MSITQVDKYSIRQIAHQRRAALSRYEREQAGEAAAQNFMRDVVMKPRTKIALYWAIRDELSCVPLCANLRAQGHDVSLPVIMGKDAPLIFRFWQPDTPLVPCGFGTYAPFDDAPEMMPDLVVMPLLGFDDVGTRLGYGGGFYDRTIAQMPQKPLLIGYGYAVQKFDHLPREAHDMPLDMMVSAQKVFFFNKRAQF